VNGKQFLSRNREMLGNMRDRAARHRPCGGMLDEGHCIRQIRKAPQGRAQPVTMPRPGHERGRQLEASGHPLACSITSSATRHDSDVASQYTETIKFYFRVALL
jgi:hypothetical protein